MLANLKFREFEKVNDFKNIFPFLQQMIKAVKKYFEYFL